MKFLLAAALLPLLLVHPRGGSAEGESGGRAEGATTKGGRRRRLVREVQDLLSSGKSALELAELLVGTGRGAPNITNAKITGDPRAFGTFSGGNESIGIERGIVLGTGCAANATGPNDLYDGEGGNFSFTSCDNYYPGDVDLDNLLKNSTINATTTDAAVLEFDFECPQGTRPLVTFKYVFGSEEYNDFVGTGFNDIFGFFLNGENIALVPGRRSGGSGQCIPVAIDSINNFNNSKRYKDNEQTDYHYDDDDYSYYYYDDYDFFDDDFFLDTDGDYTLFDDDNFWEDFLYDDDYYSGYYFDDYFYYDDGYFYGNYDERDECSSSDDCSSGGAGQRFCNFDNGDSGFCESCSDIQNGCINGGFLHVNGENECKKVCEVEDMISEIPNKKPGSSGEARRRLRYANKKRSEKKTARRRLPRVNKKREGKNGRRRLPHDPTPYNVEADGFSTPLLAVRRLKEGRNHLKLAIADVGDAHIDTWVFLEQASLTCGLKGLPVVRNEVHQFKVRGSSFCGELTAENKTMIERALKRYLDEQFDECSTGRLPTSVNLVKWDAAKCADNGTVATRELSEGSSRGKAIAEAQCGTGCPKKKKKPTNRRLQESAAAPSLAEQFKKVGFGDAVDSFEQHIEDADCKNKSSVACNSTSDDAGSCCGVKDCRCNVASASLCDFHNCCIKNAVNYNANFCKDVGRCGPNPCNETRVDGDPGTELPTSSPSVTPTELPTNSPRMKAAGTSKKKASKEKKAPKKASKSDRSPKAPRPKSPKSQRSKAKKSPPGVVSSCSNPKKCSDQPGSEHSPCCSDHVCYSKSNKSKYGKCRPKCSGYLQKCIKFGTDDDEHGDCCHGMTCMERDQKGRKRRRKESRRMKSASANVCV